MSSRSTVKSDPVAESAQALEAARSAESSAREALANSRSVVAKIVSAHKRGDFSTGPNDLAFAQAEVQLLEAQVTFYEGETRKAERALVNGDFALSEAIAPIVAEVLRLDLPEPSFVAQRPSFAESDPVRPVVTYVQPKATGRDFREGSINGIVELVLEKPLWLNRPLLDAETLSTAFRRTGSLVNVINRTDPSEGRGNLEVAQIKVTRTVEQRPFLAQVEDSLPFGWLTQLAGEVRELLKVAGQVDGGRIVVSDGLGTLRDTQKYAGHVSATEDSLQTVTEGAARTTSVGITVHFKIPAGSSAVGDLTRLENRTEAILHARKGQGVDGLGVIHDVRVITGPKARFHDSDSFAVSADLTFVSRSPENLLPTRH